MKTFTIKISEERIYRLCNTGENKDESRNILFDNGVYIQIYMPIRKTWVEIAEAPDMESSLRTLNLFLRRPYESDIKWLEDLMVEEEIL